MRTVEQLPAVLPSTLDQPGRVIHTSPYHANADPLLMAMLVETLAAARDTVARCERALGLVAGQLHPDLDAVASAGSLAGVAADTDTVTPPGERCPDCPHLLITSPPAADVRPGCVTRRETAVVRLIAAGLSNMEIAATLGVSVRTIERHITNLYRKIGAHGKADATAWAIRQHLV